MHRANIMGLHSFKKKNVITLIDDKGQYDIMICSVCGIQGKCRDMQTVEIIRPNKKAKFCNLSNKIIAEIKLKSSYEGGKITEDKCPKCEGKLSELAIYIEEGTNNYFADMMCICGWKELVDVTKKQNLKN